MLDKKLNSSVKQTI